jgi:GMP synthase-like glutamine amidotransferase
MGGDPRWREPCRRSMDPTHLITDPDVPGAPVIRLCTYHYLLAEAAGLVDDPNPSTETTARARRNHPEL